MVVFCVTDGLRWSLVSAVVCVLCVMPYVVVSCVCDVTALCACLLVV